MPSARVCFRLRLLVIHLFLPFLFVSLLWTSSFGLLVCISLASTLLALRASSWHFARGSTGVGSISTSTNCGGSKTTGVIWLYLSSCLQQLLAHRDAVLEQGLELWLASLAEGCLELRESLEPSTPVTAYWIWHRGDSSPCGQSPLDFESNSLAARTQCLLLRTSNKHGKDLHHGLQVSYAPRPHCSQKAFFLCLLWQALAHAAHSKHIVFSSKELGP